MKLRHYTIFLVALLLIISYGFNKSYNVKNVKLKKGDKVPEIVLPDTSGKSIALSSLKGKIVLIDFWASWCKPCRSENPKLRKFINKYKDAKFKEIDGFAVFSISLDEKKYPWIKAIEKDKISWIQVWDRDSKVADNYGITHLPTTFLIDQNGIILGKNMYLEDIEWKLEKYLSRK